MTFSDGMRCTKHYLINGKPHPCGKWLDRVMSEGGEMMGFICPAGHVTAIGRFARQRRCPGCSRRGRHADNCPLVDRHLWTASELARIGDEESLIKLQKLLEARFIPSLDEEESR